jgi:hypothetical protein
MQRGKPLGGKLRCNNGNGWLSSFLFVSLLTFTTGLSFSLCSQVILELTSSHIIFFDLLAAQALDLLEKLGDFVGHGSGAFGT